MRVVQIGAKEPRRKNPDNSLDRNYSIYSSLLGNHDPRLLWDPLFFFCILQFFLFLFSLSQPPSKPATLVGLLKTSLANHTQSATSELLGAKDSIRSS